MRKYTINSKVKKLIRAIKERRPEKVKKLLEANPNLIDAKHPRTNRYVISYRPGDSSNPIFQSIAEAERIVLAGNLSKAKQGQPTNIVGASCNQRFKPALPKSRPSGLI